METKVLIVCILVGFLGILSALCGFAAEATRTKPPDSPADNDRCVYPTSPATILGGVAIVVLLIAQITITIFAGCCCCCARNRKFSNSNERVPNLLAASWFTCIVASVLLLVASVANNTHTQMTVGTYTYCSYTKPGLFSGGAVFSIITIGLSIDYYHRVSRSSFSSNMDHTNQGVGPNQGSIPMAQPTVPPQGTYPPV